MLGRAAMIAVPLAPTASIAKHDDHRTEANPVRWFNVASPDLVLTAIANLNRASPDELGSGANCSDFLDCLELPTRDKGDFRHSRLLHAVRGSVRPFCAAFGRTPPVGCR